MTSADETSLAAIESVTNYGDRRAQAFDRGFLRDVTLGAKIPLSTLIGLKMRHETVEIPVHEVGLVEGPAPRGGKVFGFVVGLSVDAVVVAAIAADVNSGCSSPGPSGGYY